MNITNTMNTHTMNTTSPLMRCDICRVTLPDSSTLESHFTGKRHQKAVRSVDLRTQQEGKAVYLTKLGELRLPEVHSYMSTFGTVVNIAVGENKDIPGRLHHVIVEFESEDVVPVVLAKNMRDKHLVAVPGTDPQKFQSIKIYERKFKERARSPSPPACSSVSHDLVKLRLAIIEDCEEQLEELVSLTHLNDDDVQFRVNICKNIQKTFSRTQFSDCVIYPFGSSINGLGFNGCDLDIYLDLGEQQEMSSSNSSLMNDIPITMTEQQKVRAAMKVLKEIPQCARLTPILAARVPILKFIHRPTGIHCDISFKNRTSVKNTEYIRFCTETDVRVRPLMVAVRYLARHYGLAGGGGGLKMSNYALTMLIIVYLQQLEMPLLHTVSELQEVPGLEKDIINGWNCNFCKDFTQLKPLPVNNSTTLELLAGFFHFYSQLDFANVVLSPVVGKLIPRTEFSSDTTIVNHFPSAPSFLGPTGLQTDKPICLQDPFELTHNVCRNLPDKAVRYLVSHMREAALVVTSCLEQETRPVGGLLNLFSMELRVEEEVKEETVESLIQELDVSKRCLFLNKFKIPLDKMYLAWFSKTVQEKDGVQEDQGAGVQSDTLVEAGEHIIGVVLGDCLKMIEQEADLDSIPLDDCTKTELNDMIKDIKVEDVNTDPKVDMDEDNDDVKCDQIDISDKDLSPVNTKTKDAKEIGHVDEVKSDSGDLKRTVSLSGKEKPSKKLKLQLPIVYRVGAGWTIWSQVWAGRRKMATLMENVRENMSTVEWEAMLSSKLSEGEYRLTEPEVAFRVHLVGREGAGCVWVGLEKIQSRKKAFDSLVTWLSSFVPDLVARLVREKVGEEKGKPVEPSLKEVLSEDHKVAIVTDKTVADVAAPPQMSA